MMFRTLWLVSLVALAGCGPDVSGACEEYIASYNNCVDEEDSGEVAALPTSFCSVYNLLSGSDARDLTDQFECATAALNSGECGTVEGLDEALDIAGECLDAL